MDTLLSQILSALIGALVVYVFGIRKLSLQVRNAFIEKQLSELYAPLAGYRKRIRAKSELRERVSSAAGTAWQDLCASYKDNGIMPKEQEQFAPYKAIIEYDDQQFRAEFMPLYRKMLDVFTDKYWLAEPETRNYYSSFVEFVEIWERHLSRAIPPDVIRKLNHTEENVRPFYEHLEQKLSSLQAEIKNQPFWTMRI